MRKTGLAAVSILFTTILLASGLNVYSESWQPPTKAPVMTQYVSHGPIHIQGSDNFTAGNGVARGNGTENDPYVIENWEINASSAMGVAISYTDVHFIIKGCHIFGGGWSYPGIYLEYCTNGTLEGNVCSSNVYGIHLRLSGANTICNNTCSNNKHEGILLTLSNSNTLTNNSCSYDGFDGINVNGNNNTICFNHCANETCGILVSASYDIVLLSNICLNCNYGIHFNGIGSALCDNRCSENWFGILLESSRFNVISGNICNSNGNGVFILQSNNIEMTDFNTYSGNTCNFNVNYGIRLERSANNTFYNNTCAYNGCGIHIFLSHNNTLTRNDCISNSGRGIWLYASGSIVLCNNTCSNNGGGFYLEYSGGNSVANNTCLWNAEYGLCIVELSTGNRIWNNTFIGNNGATGTYDASRVQAFDEGTNNSWNTSGSPHGYGNYWSDWTTPDANLDDIVDQPYLINGSAGAKDYYPQTTTSTPIPEFDLVPLVLLTLMAATILLEETRRKKES